MKDMRGLTRIGLLALSALISNSAHAELYFAAAIAANYDVLVCQSEDCSFEHPESADYSGTLMLFAEPLDPTRLALPDKRTYVPASLGGAGANACFVLTHQGKGANYIWSRGLTTWGGEGAEIYLNLGSGVDAGYSAKVTQANGDGLAGTGSSWGAGVAEPDDKRLQTIIARRRGKSDLSACPTVSTEPDPAETRRTVLYRRLGEISEPYDAAIAKRLNASRNSRDWAVATLFERSSANQQSPERIARLERAMQESHDPLAYWIALHDSHKSWIDNAPEDMPERALPRMEPDNIAVWVEPLSAAVKRNDVVATATYLGRMAAATHYDAHAAQILASVVAAYRSSRIPEDYLRTGSELIDHLDATTVPYYLAAQRSLMGGGTRLDSGLPGWHELFVACTAALAPDFDAVRLMLCTHIARTMTLHSTSFNEGYDGFYLLRELNVYDVDDLALARRQRWLFDGGGASQAYVDRPDAMAKRQFVDDLISGASEEVVLRRALKRAGRPSEPPPDYPQRVHPFLGERLISTDHRVFGHLVAWIYQLTAPPGVQVFDSE